MPERFAAAAALLPKELRAAALALPEEQRGLCEELRLRLGHPPTLRLPDAERPFAAAPVTQRTLEDVLLAATGASVHAHAQELRRGYVSAPGGVRVGVCGTAVCAGGGVETLRAPSSVCIRVVRQIPGAGCALYGALHGRSVLVISAPGGGKTTFLRELVRFLSDGGTRVALVDARGELAGMGADGPGFEVGRCTDVLTGAPKAEGALMLLRAMAPECVAMDEVSAPSDAAAVAALVGCGVRVLATAHAASRYELLRRGVYRRLLDAGAFDALVTISGRGAARRYAMEAL